MPRLPKITQSQVTRAVAHPRLRTGGREPRVSLSNVGLPRSRANFRNAEVTPEAFGAGAFRLVGKLGKELAERQETIQKELAAREEALEGELEKGREVTYQTNAISAFKEFADLEEERIRAEVGPGAPGFTPLLQASLQNKMGQLESEAPTLGSRDTVTVSLARIFDTRLGKARGFQRREEVRQFDADLVEVLGRNVSAVIRNPEKLPDLFADGQAALSRAEKTFLAGRPDVTQELKDNFKKDIFSAHVETRIKLDPFSVQRDLQKGLFDKVLPADRLLTFRSKAQTAIGKLQRAAKAKEKERVAEIGKLVSDLGDAKLRGFPWRGPVSEEELGELAKGTEHDPEFRRIQGASRFLDAFNLLPPLIQEQRLRELQSGPKTGAEAKFIDVLGRAHEATKSGLESDPLTFAIDQGLFPAPPPLNVNDPASLQARSRLAGIAEAHYGVPVSPLSDAEATQLRVSMENMTADGKVGVLRSLREGLDDRHVKTVAAQFAKRDPNVLALAMGLSVDAPEAASRILRGQDILRDNPKVNPTGTELTATRDRINEALGEAYKHSPENFAAVSEAALAVYALNSWQGT